MAHTLKGVNILDSRFAVLELSTPLSFCLFATGPSRTLETKLEGILVKEILVVSCQLWRHGCWFSLKFLVATFFFLLVAIPALAADLREGVGESVAEVSTSHYSSASSTSSSFMLQKAQYFYFHYV